MKELRKIQTGRHWEGEAPAELMGLAGVLARQEARLCDQVRQIAYNVHGGADSRLFEGDAPRGKGC